MNEKENHLPNLSDKERAHALELRLQMIGKVPDASGR